jgi:hypothetical protein
LEPFPGSAYEVSKARRGGRAGNTTGAARTLADPAVGIPITHLILAELFPDKVDSYMEFLLNHVGRDAAVHEGVMTGGSQYIEFNKPNRGIAMGFARYLIQGAVTAEATDSTHVQPTKDEHVEAVLVAGLIRY